MSENNIIQKLTCQIQEKDKYIKSLQEKIVEEKKNHEHKLELTHKAYETVIEEIRNFHQKKIIEVKNLISRIKKEFKKKNDTIERFKIGISELQKEQQKRFDEQQKILHKDHKPLDKPKQKNHPQEIKTFQKPKRKTFKNFFGLL